MSLRRSILSRRTFALSKSFKEFRTLDSSEFRSEPALRPKLVNDDVSDDYDEEESDEGGAAGDSEIRRVASGRGESWSAMLPELLGEIIRRVEASEDRWPARKNVVSCACVCKRWRDITREVVRGRLDSGQITFPSCLKQPGPRDTENQCLIKRNKKNSTFYLYLALSSCKKKKWSEIETSLVEFDVLQNV